MTLAETPRDSWPSQRQRQDHLALRYQQHPGSHDAVVAELLPIVRSIARRYKRGAEPLEDLVQVGSIGLVKALQRFDPERGRCFIAYAVPTISGEIQRHYRDYGWAVHVPRRVQELAQAVNGAEREIFGRTGRSPTIAALALALDRDEVAVLEAWTAARGMRAGSLDAPRQHGDAGDSPDDRHLSVVDTDFAAAEARVTLAALTGGLATREQQILHLRYQRGLSQREIGAMVGVSQMHVSRLLRRSLDRMRQHAEAGDQAGVRQLAGTA